MDLSEATFGNPAGDLQISACSSYVRQNAPKNLDDRIGVYFDGVGYVTDEFLYVHQ